MTAAAAFTTRRQVMLSRAQGRARGLSRAASASPPAVCTATLPTSTYASRRSARGCVSAWTRAVAVQMPTQLAAYEKRRQDKVKREGASPSPKKMAKKTTQKTMKKISLRAAKKVNKKKPNMQQEKETFSFGSFLAIFFFVFSV